MARNRPTAAKKQTEVVAAKKTATPTDVAWTIAIAAATLAAFLPLVANQFVNWEDPYALTDNTQLESPHFLAWAFTTRLMGHTFSGQLAGRQGAMGVSHPWPDRSRREWLDRSRAIDD